MAVKIGSARMGENGKITGGKPGDQTGNEVSTQNWYSHSKGWRVFRAKDPAKRKLIAECMAKACANSKIGYNQNQRSTLYAAVKNKGYDPDKITDKVNTDCSALVRVCCCYAGIIVNDFNTATEASRLMGTGAFTELTGNTYTKSSDRLMAGDILVTKTKGHTVVVLSNGSKAGDSDGGDIPGSRILKNGCEGADVKELQLLLIQLGYDCGRWGADGDFGDATEEALIAFQKDHGCDADGEYGKITHAAMEKALKSIDKISDTAKNVVISGGQCYVRSEPNTNGSKLGVVKSGTILPYEGKTSSDGWLSVTFSGKSGWVSGKYGKVA